jgi:hypothetical protein
MFHTSSSCSDILLVTITTKGQNMTQNIPNCPAAEKKFAPTLATDIAANISKQPRVPGSNLGLATDHPVQAKE